MRIAPIEGSSHHHCHALNSIVHIKGIIVETYIRYMKAEMRAWSEGKKEKAIMLARWKARAYRMYAVDCPYF